MNLAEIMQRAIDKAKEVGAFDEDGTLYGPDGDGEGLGYAGLTLTVFIQKDEPPSFEFGFGSSAFEERTFGDRPEDAIQAFIDNCDES